MDNMDFNNRSQTDINESSIVPQINEQQRNGYINIQNVPVKKSKFKKAAPLIATTLVSAIVGGAAGSAYTNYLINKNSYTSPIMYSTSPGQVKTTNYTSSNSIISRIAEDVGPAVVGIDTEVVTQGAYGSTQTESGSGSGVIFDSKGLIVTNQHVIDGSKKISVTIPGRDPIPAQVLGADAMSDIAVLKISANNLPVAKLGDSSKIRVGDLAVAIGNPLGDQYAGTVTSGIISAVDRKMYVAEGDVSRRYHLIQTDAAINPGNSGGALINENGEVIGINSIKFIGDKVEGMGFAIPINEVKDIVDQLMKNGYVSRPLLGIGAVTVTPEDAQKYKSTVGAGVEEIQKGGAAEAAGLKLKDIITEVDGTKIKTSDDLISLLEKHKVGDTVKLKIWREGNYITISVTLTDSKKFTS